MYNIQRKMEEAASKKSACEKITVNPAISSIVDQEG